MIPSVSMSRETNSEHSITTCLGRLIEGDPTAAQLLWDRYFERLVRLAHERLRDVPRSDSDEEDVALSAFHNFFDAVSARRVADLRDRDDLWRTLALIVVGKAIDRRRRYYSRKRGGGRTPADAASALEAALGAEADPADAALMADELDSLLARLPDEELRRIAVLKLDGYTNEEIAQAIDTSLRSVARRLAVIRRTWEEARGPGDD